MRTTTMLGAPGLAVAGVLAAVAALTGLSGCAPGSAVPTTSPAPPVVTDTGTSSAPAPTTSPPATIDPTEAEILRVYDEFMDARAKTLQSPKLTPDSRIDQTSSGNAKNDLLNLAVYFRARKMALSGIPVSSVGSVELNGDSAKFIDCLDSTHSFPIFVKTGKSALAPDQPRRVPINVSVSVVQDEWHVVEWVPRRGETC